MPGKTRGGDTSSAVHASLAVGDVLEARNTFYWVCEKAEKKEARSVSVEDSSGSVEGTDWSPLHRRESFVG